MSEELDKQEKRENKFAEAIAEIAHSQMGYFYWLCSIDVCSFSFK